MRVLVTVGTTKFPELVASAVDPEIASLLVSMGYNHMEIQVGPIGVESINNLIDALADQSIIF